MKKRILSLAAVLAFSAVSLFGSNVFASQSTSATHVQPPSGSYVKTLFIDDDFEDRTIGGKIGASSATAYTNPLVSSGTSGQIQSETSGNKYYETGGWEKYYAKLTSNYVGSDRLAISMDLSNPTAFAGGTATAQSGVVANPVIYINNAPMFRLNLIEKSAAQGLEVKYFTSTGVEKNFKNQAGNNYVYTNQRASGTPWNHIYLVLKRTLNSDNETYTVELEKLVVNGNEFFLGEVAYDNTTPRFEASADWWTSNATVSNIFRFGNSENTYYIDNVLIYEPYAEGEQPEVPVDPVEPEEPGSDDVTTKVQRPAYLPKIGTLVVDESFDASVVSGAYVESNYEYSLTNVEHDTTDAAAYGLVAENNKYSKFKSYGKKPKSKITGSIDSDSFVVSFDVKCPSKGGFNIYFGGTTGTFPLRLYFDNYSNDTTKWQLYLCNSGTATTSKFAEPSLVPKDAFTKVSVVCKRVNVGGEVKAVLSEAYINDTPLDLIADKDKSLSTNWFETVSGEAPLIIGNFSVTGFALDNVLAYAPSRFSAKSAKLSSDGLKAEITFSETIANIDAAAVVAVDMFGNITNPSAITSEGTKLTATFASPLNVKDKVYTLTVSGVKNSSDETAVTYIKACGTGLASIDVDNKEVKINNDLTTPIDGNFIIAAFDNSNVCLGAAISAFNAPTGTAVTVSNVKLPTTLTVPDKYRLFILSKNTCIPYCNYTEIPVQ